ncbi:MAG: DUF2071 domain-containing protein [Verrucomicrobiae bacterium]|nr:DUF2071 domain-containing protein [Verrucomicrobiae bacterium]
MERMVLTPVSGMLGRLKRHPFPVVAHFDRVLALSFAFPADALSPFVPAPLELDVHGEHGFVTVALVWTRGLRPAGFPEILGRKFFLAGYRIFVRAEDGNRRLRGLKILRSETDSRFMVWTGNLMTHYRYRNVTLEESDGWLRTRGPDGTKLEMRYDLTEDTGLPEGSPFADWRAARRFAGPMPFTFDLEAPGGVIAVEGRRASWSPRPFRVESCHVAMFDEAPFRDCAPLLANAFVVENVDYRWEAGRLLEKRRNDPES